MNNFGSKQNLLRFKCFEHTIIFRICPAVLVQGQNSDNKKCNPNPKKGVL